MSKSKSLLQSLKQRRHRLRNERRFLEALRRGDYALPPPSVKLAIIERNLPASRPRVFIETGTYHGETVAAMKPLYASVISIEIDDTLYRKACERFAGDTNVRIVHGDCSGELPSILATLREPAVFWLDGHFSGAGTGQGVVADPILLSLDQIAAHPVKEHVIFIDDARTFDGRDGRPDLSEVLNRLKKINDRYILRIQADVVIAATTVAPPVC
ncbi:MAG: hypothetical protein HZC54_16630 [Verrucomicrobia bacterium]|nr:hypothetical protein [Verrucomicrobiota bacterium]